MAQTPVATSSDGRPDADKQDWIVLFNGKDLKGWTPKIAKHDLGDNFGNTFRVEDGLLKVRYDKVQELSMAQFGHLFWKDPYSYYKLVVEYRFVGKQAPGNPGAWALRNSGAMLHSPDPRTMPRDQNFPDLHRGPVPRRQQRRQAALDRQHVLVPARKSSSRASCIPDHCLNSSSPTFDGEQWVRAEIRSARRGQHHALREWPEGARIRAAAVRRRRGRQLQHHHQAGWRAHRRRLHLAAERVAPDRLPQGGAAEPRRLHGQERH